MDDVDVMQRLKLVARLGGSTGEAAELSPVFIGDPCDRGSVFRVLRGLLVKVFPGASFVTDRFGERLPLVDEILHRGSEFILG